MKKLYLLLCICSMCTLAIRAQENVSWKTRLTSADRTTWKGVRISYDHTNMRYSGGNDLKRIGYNGISAGYVHSFNLGRKLPLFLETGAGLDFFRHSFDGSEGRIVEKVSTNILGLNIPANVVYKINITDKIAVKPYTGLYLRLNLLAKEKFECGLTDNTSEEAVNLFDGDLGESWNRVQLGWQIGAAVDYGCYNVGVGYAIDFNPIAVDSRLGVFSLRLGLNF